MLSYSGSQRQSSVQMKTICMPSCRVLADGCWGNSAQACKWMTVRTISRAAHKEILQPSLECLHWCLNRNTRKIEDSLLAQVQVRMPVSVNEARAIDCLIGHKAEAFGLFGLLPRKNCLLPVWQQPAGRPDSAKKLWQHNLNTHLRPHLRESLYGCCLWW